MHVHRVLWELVTGYHQRFRGRIKLPWILKANNKQMLDVSYLNAFMEQGNDMLCYNWALGDRSYRNFRFCHVNKEQVPDYFAK